MIHRIGPLELESFLMPKIPDDMSAAAVKKRAQVSEEMKAKVRDLPPPAPPKIRIAKKR